MGRVVDEEVVNTMDNNKDFYVYKSIYIHTFTPKALCHPKQSSFVFCIKLVEAYLISIWNQTVFNFSGTRRFSSLVLLVFLPKVRSFYMLVHFESGFYYYKIFVV